MTEDYSSTFFEEIANDRLADPQEQHPELNWDNDSGSQDSTTDEGDDREELPIGTIFTTKKLLPEVRRNSSARRIGMDGFIATP